MGLQLSKRQIVEKILFEFIEGELGDYSFEWKIVPYGENDCDGWFYYDLKYHIEGVDFEHAIILRVNPDLTYENIEIDLGEDNWKAIENFNSSIKYFWMKIKWE